MRELHVFINSERVGVLSEEDDIWAFTYNGGWLENADSYPLSQHIPLTANKQVVYGNLF
jgi:serine/threonine-protein kinase HipA